MAKRDGAAQDPIEDPAGAATRAALAAEEAEDAAHAALAAARDLRRDRLALAVRTATGLGTSLPEQSTGG